jgi:hypothetical protein
MIINILDFYIGLRICDQIKCSTKKDNIMKIGFHSAMIENNQTGLMVYSRDLLEYYRKLGFDENWNYQETIEYSKKKNLCMKLLSQ